MFTRFTEYSQSYEMVLLLVIATPNLELNSYYLLYKILPTPGAAMTSALVAEVKGNSSHSQSYFSAFLSDNATERKKEEGTSVSTQGLAPQHWLVMIPLFQKLTCS